jgi:peptidoglycan L-alanyl-D-glutamate endopeptidase CwlK
MFKGQDKLKGVHPDLVKVVNRAEEIYSGDAIITEGLRSVTQQIANVKKGVSWTMRSKHLQGRAVDVVPLVHGRPSWEWKKPLYDLAKAFKQASKELGIPIVWGGDWKTTKDGPHYELTSATPKAVLKTVGAKFAGVGLIGTTLTDAANQIAPVQDFTPWLKYIFIALLLGGTAFALYDKFFDRKPPNV